MDVNKYKRVVKFLIDIVEELIGDILSEEKSFMTEQQKSIINEILEERKRQDEKWGKQNHFPQYWTGILGEEFGELCEAVNETVLNSGTDKGGYENMKREAIQIAAVAVGFLECLERNRERWKL